MVWASPEDLQSSTRVVLVSDNTLSFYMLKRRYLPLVGHFPRQVLVYSSARTPLRHQAFETSESFNLPSLIRDHAVSTSLILTWLRLTFYGVYH